MSEYVVGVTGASGGLCARDFIRSILTVPEVRRIHVVVSHFAQQALRAELPGVGPEEAGLRRALAGDPSGRIVFHATDNMAATISSGSYPNDGMVIIPCSMGTLGAISSGVSTNLIHRAADVTLKERRPLILAIRETPLNRIHLKNLVAASEAGAVIFPLVPSFYTRPAEVEEILTQFSARILDQLHLPHSLGRRWGA
ncbi:MAG: UbiX family flavin prenyltransferase [Acidobacteria bacterium]|nr:UbiX family flavin prenyltransferase [Acidobacteriota bacterium]MCI0567447.1 UbiX family flavin prenyltransferase [Acidobacteriota bacterium]